MKSLRTCQSGADRIAVLVDQNTGVVIEFDVAAILPLQLLGRPDHDGMPYVAPPDFVGDAQSASAEGFAAEGFLLLHHHDNSIS